MQLGNVTTNQSNKWKDMLVIKQNLWNKLHGTSSSVKNSVRDEMNKLA